MRSLYITTEVEAYERACIYDFVLSVISINPVLVWRPLLCVWPSFAFSSEDHSVLVDVFLVFTTLSMILTPVNTSRRSLSSHDLHHWRARLKTLEATFSIHRNTNALVAYCLFCFV